MNNNDDNDVWIFDVFQRVLICFDVLSGFGHYVVSIGFWNSSSKERCVSNSAGGIGMAWQDSSVNVQLESARCLGHLGAMSVVHDFSIFFWRLLVFSLVFLCDCGVGCVCSFTYHGNRWDLPHKYGRKQQVRSAFGSTRCNNGQDNMWCPSDHKGIWTISIDVWNRFRPFQRYFERLKWLYKATKFNKVDHMWIL